MTTLSDEKDSAQGAELRNEGTPGDLTYADDEEDVPADFFDDFSNQDFMAGLDIVDAWDEDDHEGSFKLDDSLESIKQSDKHHEEKQSLKSSPSHRYDRRNRTKSRSPRGRHGDRRRRSPRSDHADTKSDKKRDNTESRRDNTESRRNNMGPRRDNVGSRKDNTESRRDNTESRRDNAESRRDNSESRRDNVESRRDNTEPRVDSMESRRDSVESKIDHRRDPQKTKRDIQKDKDRCAKDKEAKIISEKLMVVETGLVPPGMEMEVDLQEFKSLHEQDVVKSVSARDGKDQNKESLKKEESRGGDAKKTLIERRYNYSRKRKSKSKSVEYRRNNYVVRDNRERHFSPPRKRSRSPRPNYERRFRVSPIREPPRPFREHRKINLDIQANNDRIARYRNTSPTIIRRNPSLSLSPVSNLSERELWMCNRNYKREIKRSRSRERDRNRKSKDFLEELANKLNSEKKKKTYLKEIHEKLNESSCFRPPPLPVPPPVPAPMVNPIMPMALGPPPPMHGPGFMSGHLGGHPNNYYPDIAPQFNQQFFIGQNDAFPNNNSFLPYTSHPPDSLLINSVVPSPLVPSHTSPTISSNVTLVGSCSNNVDLLNRQAVMQPSAEKEKDQLAVAKLYEDKKISLSDFLMLSSKFTDQLKEVNVQKKIKVISMCQDAIKALGGDTSISGRFFVRKRYRETEKKEDSPFQSPLRKIPVIRFSFTTPIKAGEEKSLQQNNLYKLLSVLGLHEPMPNSDLGKPSSLDAFKSAFKKCASVKATLPRKYDPILGAKFQMKMCQTDPIKCNMCEIRLSREYVDQGVQCNVETADSATQITEDDLIRLGIKATVKDTFKNKSLAHLTPAQILAAQKPADSADNDVVFLGISQKPPPAPLISPEKRFNFNQAPSSRNVGSSYYHDVPEQFEKRPNFDNRFRGNTNFPTRKFDEEENSYEYRGRNYNNPPNQRLFPSTGPPQGARKFF